MHGSERHGVWNARSIRVERGPRAAPGAVPGADRPAFEARTSDAESVSSTQCGKGNVMKILLATDGSSCSHAAVDDIAARPWPAGSEVRIISVYEPPMLPTAEA